MTSANGTARRQDPPFSVRFAGRSFVVANNLGREAVRSLEREIEVCGGLMHPFLNAVTDVLVVGCVDGIDSNAHWAREQVRRGEMYRERWGHTLSSSRRTR